MRQGRVIRPELMDTEAVGYAEFEQCLRQLEALNHWTLAYRPTLGWLARALEGTGRGRVVSILDVGCGHGDMLRRIHAWGARRGYRFQLTGIDLNPLARRAAESATPRDLPIAYETSDVFAVPDQRRFDFVISAIFAHHLEDEGVARFLRWMEHHARLGWLINDLHRHAVPYLFLKSLFRLGRFNRLVEHDGPVSVGRAFKRSDWERLIAQAGLSDAAVEIRWRFPFRWAVGRLK
jgi:2-polyprenyl-3-methyl-5-hydroxy-6-metoxy-1,4-benzoquinol methylase